MTLPPRVILRAYCPKCKEVTLAVEGVCHWCDTKVNATKDGNT